MLDIETVTVIHNRGRVDEVTALAGLSLHIEAGQFVTVVGTNGAGKSTLVQIIAGALFPTQGTVRIDGVDVTRTPDYRRAGLVARVFDDPRRGTAPELSIEDNMALALMRGRRRGLRPSLSASRRATMREALSQLGLGLEDRLGDRVGMLSAGQRQSLTMVMAGLAAPKVLLLDEHLAALDPGTTDRVLALTLQLVAEMGTTTIMITHNMAHAIDVGDRMLLMSRGRVLRDFDAEVKTNLTITELAGHVTRAGDTLADRTLLQEAS